MWAAGSLRSRVIWELISSANPAGVHFSLSFFGGPSPGLTDGMSTGSPVSGDRRKACWWLSGVHRTRHTEASVCLRGDNPETFHMIRKW